MEPDFHAWAAQRCDRTRTSSYAKSAAAVPTPSGSTDSTGVEGALSVPELQTYIVKTPIIMHD